MYLPKLLLNSLRLLLAVSLVSYSVWQVRLIGVSFFQTEQEVSQQMKLTPIVDYKQQAAGLNIASIAKLNLFGEFTLPADKKTELITVDVPETKLNIKLKGLRLGKGTIPSTATIQGADSRQIVYQLGESLIDNEHVIINQIHEQYLILKHKDSYETLTLFEVLEKEKNYKHNTESINPIPNSEPKVKQQINSDPPGMWVLPKR